MYLLSIESSTQHFALAVSKGPKVLRSRTFRVNQLLENSIIGAIDRILAAAGITLNDVDGFVVGLGPGSFTSLRIGLSTVKAFALATGKPVAGIGSLDIIASAAAGTSCDEVCVIVDARRSLLYSTIYRKTASGLQQQGDYALLPLDQVLDTVQGETLFVGDGVGVYRKEIERAYKEQGGKCRAEFAPEKMWRPQPRQLAQLGYRRFIDGKYDDPATLLPMYLYAQDCQVTLKK